MEFLSKKLSIAESVGKGHPDKICDQISDAILDNILKQDSNARVAIETMASNRLIIIAGEIKTHSYVDFVQIAWNIVKSLGYSENDFTIISNVNSQSADIAQGVDKESGLIGAGDQGIVYGYASKETTSYMPLAHTIAHELLKLAEKLRVSGDFLWAKADMKSQVEIDFSNQKPKINKIIMSVQHDANYDHQLFVSFIKEKIMKKVAVSFGLNTDFETLINTTGKFVIGGPIGDTGLTGRKIIIDSYGDRAHHGGGAFSGKDYTKVDRSGAYAARWVAKNLVAAGVADEIEVQLSYAIGLPEPTSIAISQSGERLFEESKLIDVVKKVFNLSVVNVINELGLKAPIYQQTATYGHFGRDDLNLPWESLNKVDKIKQLLNIK
ncbi:S-adenosylmethionine synthase [Mesomycoplasma conjunctivae]|uniref:Methionine adenosyltransferase n=1 Tax=Mesomycoplasma conjunctivae (strain ATCC 25834 / NCTC 10147 / HRC/581) TaxID=572263 RepID=C5J6H2_MESCH|nr:methionine adenosyltransferase [Mesomycoplasma conjunctivae]CAT05064.1 S-adenosylmethionine synthetase [Mesomycoplasma conjunctivae]VEU66279.1 S-adenosylmethionine synthase [Mesomycoplasma conjunctivae]